jgi:hypothetical protein
VPSNIPQPTFHEVFPPKICMDFLFLTFELGLHVQSIPLTFNALTTLDGLHISRNFLSNILHFPIPHVSPPLSVLDRR